MPHYIYIPDYLVSLYSMQLSSNMIIILINPFTPKFSFVIDSLPCNSDDVSLGNLVLNQLIICKLIFFIILITCLLDFVLYCKKKFCCGHSWDIKV